MATMVLVITIIVVVVQIKQRPCQCSCIPLYIYNFFYGATKSTFTNKVVAMICSLLNFFLSKFLKKHKDCSFLRFECFEHAKTFFICVNF